MFWDKIEPVITAPLQDAVDNAYAVFGRYRLSGTIVHCDCPSCMMPEVAAKLSSLPLKNIGVDLLSEYTNSAHGYDRGQIEIEFKYFLPRYFDLIAQCQPPSPLDLEFCLRRLDGYRNNWPDDEIETVDTFFDAFLEASLRQGRLLKWPVGYRLEFDIGAILAMIVLAGGDLKRALSVIDRVTGPITGVHLASLRMELQMRDSELIYDNAFLDDHPDAALEIGRWLESNGVMERILAAADQLGGGDYDDILNFGF
ncbi:hypothetical protein [uncultured Roseibium sp.]|uniref:hypothetical protein n=1 Tax=uncultured Roseibium sp. TaxID=1936171 RepID=UPI002607038A|nr:hypothetical protein [uncultured Roseibium sp.]